MAVTHSTKSWSTTLPAGSRNNRSPTGAPSRLIFVHHDQERQKQHEIWAYLVPLESQTDAPTYNNTCPRGEDAGDSGAAPHAAGRGEDAGDSGAAPHAAAQSPAAAPGGATQSSTAAPSGAAQSPATAHGGASQSPAAAPEGTTEATACAGEVTVVEEFCDPFIVSTKRARREFLTFASLGLKEAYWHKAHDTLQRRRNGDVWRLVTVHHDKMAGVVHEVWECKKAR